MFSVTEWWKPKTCIYINIGPWGKYCVECYLIPLSAEEQLKVNGRGVDIDLNKPGFKLRCLQHAETIHFFLSIPEIMRLTFTAKFICGCCCCFFFVVVFFVYLFGVVGVFGGCILFLISSCSSAGIFHCCLVTSRSWGRKLTKHVTVHITF